MARPMLRSIPYYPMDVNFLHDMKVRRMMRACGANAIAVLLYLLGSIYGDEGYYMVWHEDMAFLISDSLGVKEGLVEEIVKKALQVDFFHQGMFDDFGVLTSAGIQRRYFKATEKRKNDHVDARFLLVCLSADGVIESETPVSASETPVNASVSTQRIVDDSKVKDRIVDDDRDKCAQKLVSLLSGTVSSSSAQSFLGHFKPEEYAIVLEAVKKSDWLKANLDVEKQPTPNFCASLLAGEYRSFKQPAKKSVSSRTDQYSSEELEAMARKKWQKRSGGKREGK